MRPELNRFICGHRTYAKNDLDVGFIAKKEYVDDSKDVLLKISFESTDDIFDVTDKLYDGIEKVKNNDEDSDDIVVKLSKYPRFINRIVFSTLKLLNYYGKVPNSIVTMDPHFSSIFISNMGSIQSGAPIHHLNDWGTNSVFLCVGKIYDKVCLKENGDAEYRPHIDFVFTLDERISTGYYLAKTFELLVNLIENPKMENLQKRI